MCRVDVIKECPNSAPPPWHSVAILVGFVTCFVYYLPSFESIDEDATAANFSNVLFKSVLDLRTLACIRLVIASSIWATSLHTVLGEGWVQDTAYLKGSKLKRVSNRLRGVSTMFPFTSVSWNLLGAAFTCSGMIALKMDRQEPLHPYLLRAALILWEISGPTTLLVAAVIRYAIWPGVLRSGGDTSNLKCFRNFMMHNMNAVFALTEAALLGGLPVRWKHCAMAPLVGCAYIVFSWCMQKQWNTPENGPQFIYFFFDTTLPKMHSTALIMLLSALMVFYNVFVVASEALQLVSGGMLTHVIFVAVVSSSVMRFRD